MLKCACKFHIGENPIEKHFRSEQKMKDIIEILKDNGVAVDESKHKDIRRSFTQHYVKKNI